MQRSRIEPTPCVPTPTADQTFCELLSVAELGAEASECLFSLRKHVHSRLTSPFSGGAPHLRRTAADPAASTPVGRVHFIVIRPLQRVVRRHFAMPSTLGLGV